MIEFIDTSKVYRSDGKEIKALDQINLKINKGDIFGVIGFSGAGKSTLLRTVNLLETPTSGKVLVDGVDLTTYSAQELREKKKEIGMIFQHFNLLNSKTVFENVAMPLLLSKVPKNEIRQRVMEVLRYIGLEDRSNAYIHQLSGGQKQRVGIARALVTNPKILLCDEPTSALDPQTTKSILNLLKKVNVEYNITILLITHEMEVIREICNKVAVMENGRVIETGNVLEIFSNPKEKTTKNFVQSVVRDEIPEFIIKMLQDDNPSKRIFKLKFIGENVGQSIVSEVAKKFKVDVNVLFGNIIELQEIPFGNLIIEIKGDHRECERAIQYIRLKDIQIEEVAANGSELRNYSQRNFGNLIYG
ncbi:methionine ABC transporter ATP-binding protein [Ureibacillus sp. FSL K6-8385]|uniref:Methionine ABC transporter ATP-binding protein n=1 Tax=Ureibacillus terrenus TaxID=118246 RepID=A0A540V3G9_9BACL|nr:methionine ABC transporter ATP-binding protein [Ureibacillus terrenus]MED3662743.1 methionine ABC transporter ATP-binding protein [Ureibacillus terrenus]MED3763690.1 methionine ABC transporter ATP-binding protein [Ureibacillus terrenus]TQE91291.1 methionine ABC transporter ATP-binding protein [Ureibacillus terrenus]